MNWMKNNKKLAVGLVLIIASAVAYLATGDTEALKAILAILGQ